MWTQATRDQVAAIEKKTKRYPSDLKNQHEAAAGSAQRGQRIEAKAPHGRWQTTTLSGRLAPRSRRGSLAD